ncbi:hypothetical protein FJT64_018718 [Amphibalanus amphitrite]|uniref:Retrotransposon gag domain-containing protein n=1 Tax=Amphibalanus amphitrite TaxID=1232801 RepID=A0A6A4X2C5_AMPAM|nr:hypothetical protein FJT64_018718 [Amphibalanus amphitrite]
MDTPTETGAVVQGSEQVRIGAGLDPRLMDEYDGSGDVVEWHTQASLLCEYRGVSAAEVLPMRLKGGAFAVWSQLSAVDRRSVTATRDALFKAFAMDDFAAHTAFVARRLEPGESADVFLASLRRYAALFGGVTDRQLVAAFVNGLPASVADTIRAGTRSEQLSLESTVARARAVLVHGPVLFSYLRSTSIAWVESGLYSQEAYDGLRDRIDHPSLRNARVSEYVRGESRFINNAVAGTPLAWSGWIGRVVRFLHSWRWLVGVVGLRLAVVLNGRRLTHKRGVGLHTLAAPSDSMTQYMLHDWTSGLHTPRVPGPRLLELEEGVPLQEMTPTEKPNSQPMD